MLRYTGFAIAALVIAAAACSDQTSTGPAFGTAPNGVTVKMDTLRGTIRLNGDDAVNSGDIVLITGDGSEVTLLGPVAELLWNAQGRELWVQGQLTLDNEMIVSSYAFRSDDPNCKTPIVQILPDIGQPCDQPVFRPIDPNTRPSWNKIP